MRLSRRPRANPAGEMSILEPRSGPKLTWDDLLDLHLELESPDWWARFQAACR